MSKLLGEIGRGYARGGVITIASTIIMFSLICVLICFPLWLGRTIGCPTMDIVFIRRLVVADLVWQYTNSFDWDISGAKKEIGQCIPAVRGYR